jgi:hypothetical protein
MKGRIQLQGSGILIAEDRMGNGNSMNRETVVAEDNPSKKE